MGVIPGEPVRCHAKHGSAKHLLIGIEYLELVKEIFSLTPRFFPVEKRTGRPLSCHRINKLHHCLMRNAQIACRRPPAKKIARPRPLLRIARIVAIDHYVGINEGSHAVAPDHRCTNPLASTHDCGGLVALDSPSVPRLAACPRVPYPRRTGPPVPRRSAADP